MDTLVLGLGNPILSDDSVGLKIAELIGENCQNLEYCKASGAGFRIIDQIIGYKKLVLIDAICTGQVKPGTLIELSVDDFKKGLHTTSPHDLNLFQVLDLFKQYGEELPEIIKIYGIEAKDVTTFSEECTSEVEKTILNNSKIIIQNEAFIMKPNNNFKLENQNIQ